MSTWPADVPDNNEITTSERAGLGDKAQSKGARAVRWLLVVLRSRGQFTVTVKEQSAVSPVDVMARQVLVVPPAG